MKTPSSGKFTPPGTRLRFGIEGLVGFGVEGFVRFGVEGFVRFGVEGLVLG